MELKLHRPHATCTQTGRPFVAGEPLVSALVRSEGRLDRCDYAADAWTGPPANALAWWRWTYPATTAAGATLAPADVLLDVLEELEGSEPDAALRYLVTLELVRRRVLRFIDRPLADRRGTDAERRTIGDAGQPAMPADLVVACRKRDREYVVRAVSPQQAAAPSVEERFTALLWSGGAA
jgi:hypothetical protein